MYSATNSFILPQQIKREINNQLIRPCTYVDYGFVNHYHFIKLIFIARRKLDCLLLL